MRKLRETIVIEAPRHAVWEAMADFGSAANWAPGMKHSTLKGDITTGVGTYRVMRHKWGFRIEEIVTHWEEDSGYSFRLEKAPYPMCDVVETWLLTGDESRSKLKITVSYNMRLGLIGKLLDDRMVRFVVANEMHHGIIGLKHYVEQRFAGRLKDRQAG